MKNRWVAKLTNLALLAWVTPMLAQGVMALLVGEAPDLVGVLFVATMVQLPLGVVALGIWHLVVREPRLKLSSLTKRFVLRSIKAIWVCAAPLLLMIPTKLHANYPPIDEQGAVLIGKLIVAPAICGVVYAVVRQRTAHAENLL